VLNKLKLTVAVLKTNTHQNWIGGDAIVDVTSLVCKS